jgi:hypothetical protein
VVTRLFWILLTAEFSVFVVLIVLILFTNILRSGPEGPVGAIVLLDPPIYLAILGAIVYFARSEGAARTGLIVLALQLVPVVLGPIYSGITKYQVSRSIQGDDSFRGAQRDLAHAIKAGDLAKVKELLPAAGELNTAYEGESLFRFAVMNVGTGGSTIEIVQALLAAGANPNFRAGSTSPLEMAIFSGPPLVKLLLDAGADPNLLDSANRPAWWNAIQHGNNNDLSMLQLFLLHGADISLRDNESGPVGYAAEAKNWTAVWFLMQRGAAWKGEARYGTSLLWNIDYALHNGSDSDRDLLKRISEIVNTEAK